MDILIPLLVMGLALFGTIASAAGHESREGFERQDH
jgi:hypothetical protein